MKKTTLLALILVFALCLPMFAACDVNGEQGAQGEAGKKGDKGDKGDTGVGIAKVEIVNGELIITYTDGTVTNAGALASNAGTYGLEYYPLPDGTYAVSAGTTKYLEEIVIPAEYNGKAVTVILDIAFRSAANLKKITIPDSVTSIGDSAFEYCSSLTSVYISDIAAWCNIDFSSSASNPLYYAENLYLNGEFVTDLVIPDSVTSISDLAFYHCSSLTSITIPDSVTSIGSAAFSKCSSLTSITIPDSVTSIGDGAFRDCSSLESVYYTGTEEQWSEISIGSSNSLLENATIVYNYVPEE